MNNLHTQAIDFLNTLFKKVDSQIPLSENWDIDHLCYRTETPRDYEQTKSEFASFSNLLIESPVNGRMISTFKLNQPIIFRQWKIDLIEVPAPKAGKNTPRGFEHIEVVCDADLFLLKEKFSHLQLDTGGLNKKFNKELEVVLGDENIKFHNYSLESVIRFEKKASIYSVLNSEILSSLLKNYNTLVVGTYPLDLENTKSDLDILAQGSFEEVTRLIQNYVGKESVTIKTNTLNFKINETPVQIYVCNQSPTFQQSFQHFQVEEKILKYARSLDLVALKQQRQSNTKNEKAFATALQIVGDEYDVLEKMNRLSIAELDRLLNHY